jgi:hypothetical protein
MQNAKTSISAIRIAAAILGVDNLYRVIIEVTLLRILRKLSHRVSNTKQFHFQ